jgi:hypothetical protein
MLRSIMSGERASVASSLLFVELLPRRQQDSVIDDRRLSLLECDPLSLLLLCGTVVPTFAHMQRVACVIACTLFVREVLAAVSCGVGSAAVVGGGGVDVEVLHATTAALEWPKNALSALCSRVSVRPSWRLLVTTRLRCGWMWACRLLLVCPRA